MTCWTVLPCIFLPLKCIVNAETGLIASYNLKVVNCILVLKPSSLISDTKFLKVKWWVVIYQITSYDTQTISDNSITERTSISDVSLEKESYTVVVPVSSNNEAYWFEIPIYKYIYQHSVIFLKSTIFTGMNC